MRHLSKYWLVFLIFMINANFTSLAATDPPLNVVPATYQKVDREYVVNGVVEAVKQATVTAQTSGQVLAVNFDVDDFVKKGAVLVRLKNIEQKASLAQMKARVAEAKAHIDAAKKEYNRVRKLRARKVASAALFDKAVAALEATKAQLSAANEGVNQAKQQLAYTTIKAPYSGVVLQRHIELGEIASPGKKIMTGFSPKAFRVLVAVPQSRIETIRRHKRARILLNVEPKVLRFKGKKLTIAPYADPQTHTFRIRVDFPKNIKGVYPGMFAKIAFSIGQERRLLIPVSAAAYRGEVRAVYIVDKEGRVSMRHVRLGRLHSDKIEILAGLDEGEQIATNPVDAAIRLKAQRATSLTGIHK
jgi:RND family efflux transporter MFP subunit